MEGSREAGRRLRGARGSRGGARTHNILLSRWVGWVREEQMEDGGWAWRRDGDGDGDGGPLEAEPTSGLKRGREG